MAYTTVYETSEQNEIALVKNIFEQNNVRYKILDESTNTNFLLGARVQVHENDLVRTKGLLKENGFLQDPDPLESSVSRSKLWLWFVVAIICLVVAAFLINMVMS